jgi:hypothetical protein
MFRKRRDDSDSVESSNTSLARWRAYMPAHSTLPRMEEVTSFKVYCYDRRTKTANDAIRCARRSDRPPQLFWCNHFGVVDLSAQQASVACGWRCDLCARHYNTNSRR